MSCCLKENYFPLETVKSTFGLSQTSRETCTMHLDHIALALEVLFLLNCARVRIHQPLLRDA